MRNAHVINSCVEDPSVITQLSGWVLHQKDDVLANMVMKNPDIILGEGGVVLTRRLSAEHWGAILEQHPKLGKYVPASTLAAIDPLIRKALLRKFSMSLSQVFMESDRSAA